MCIVLGVIFAVTIYHLRPESANGRILVWKISLEMVKDRVLIGHGIGSFADKYVKYQINYFKGGKRSVSEQMLSDEVDSAFNEFLQVLCECGIIGLLFIIVIYVRALNNFKRNIRELHEDQFYSTYKIGVKAGLLSFLVFSFFSYPFSVTELALLFFVLLALSQQKLTNSNIGNESKYCGEKIMLKVFVGSLTLLILFSANSTMSQFKAYQEWHIGSTGVDGKVALEHYKKAYKVLKGNGIFLSSYAGFLLQHGQVQHSISLIEQKEGKKYNDFLILSEGYEKKGQTSLALKYLKSAHYLLPHRFIPLWKMLLIYRREKKDVNARSVAIKILSMNVKVESREVRFIKREAFKELKRKRQ